MVSVSKIKISDLEHVKIKTQIAGQSAGRKFEILDTESNQSSLCTMNSLYLRAVELYKTASTHEDLKKLDAFIFQLFDAEDAGTYEYSKKDNLYKFRTFFHQLAGGAFLGTHSSRLRKLLNKVEQKSSRLIFNENAYLAPAKPKAFEGALLSEDQFAALMQQHRSLLDEDGPGTHGYALQNLQMAYLEGKGNTMIEGNVPFFTDEGQNRAFHTKIQETLTLISKMKLIDQERYMRSLTTAFRACNAGRIHIVQQISDTLLSNHANPDFEGRVERLLHEYKIAIFDQMIREINARENMRSISLQIPHLTSGYLAAVGEEIGLNGYEEAKTDKHKFRVDTPHKNDFIKKFKTRLGMRLNDMVKDLVREINDPNSDFHPVEGRGFGAWVSSKVMNNELPSTFAYYLPEKDYTGSSPVSEEQEDNLAFYISRDEVLQILKNLNYL